MRARRWTWTLNNPTREEEVKLSEIGEEQARYIIYGREVAPSTNTVHLQGYVEFTTLKSLTQLKCLVGERIHAEKSNGTGVQNREYCMKDGDFQERGSVPVAPGARTDLEEIRELIRSGATDGEIAETHFKQWVRYRTSFQAYRMLLRSEGMKAKPSFELSSFPWTATSLLAILNGSTKSLIMWGEAGIGKTQFAMALLPDALVVTHMDDLRSFDSNSHNGIIFDDMDFKHMPRSSQIHIVDREIGRSIHCRYECAWIPPEVKKIFTTNEESGEVVDLSDAAIRRRVSVERLIK